MQVLELRQLALAAGLYRVEATLRRNGVAALTASSEFSFSLSTQDRERLRWYLEDYLLQPGPVEKKIADRIETKLIKEVGVDLFNAVFSDSKGQRLWGKLEDDLTQTRIEVRTDVAGSTAIPWELLREPRTDAVLALRARSFVRVQSETAVSVRVPDTAAEDGPIRILLVICRPGRDSDVPFRSVASRLVKCLKASDREHLQLEVLRPATYARLAMVLRAAEAEGKPYHIVHFDGHGAFLELPKAEESTSLGERMRQMLRSLAPTSTATYGSLLLSEHRPGAHGYLVFENPRVEDNLQLVDGPALGRLLYETRVSALVLNACRSAHAEPPSEPLVTVEDDDEAGDDQEDRVYGSLAHEVIEQGVPGVVAMRHNVYVVTAAQFVADLYTALVAGRSLGEAVAAGRKQLAAEPLRTIAYEPVPLRDWSVPIVYEHQPIQLFPDRSNVAPTLRIKIDSTRSIEAVSEREVGLPPQPDVGFIGRDSTILALDRAFDSHQVVLLHAYAGSGKTTTAVEFARWYELTGGLDGLDGRVLFTSFEQYRPLARVLDTVGQVFGPMLEANEINWLALDDARRRDVALQLLGQVPVLWVWDNVEPVTGFPKGAPTAFSDEEQRELVDFLRAARRTKAKFLLTSRRDESDWLVELPRRIAVGPMPFQERVELARVLMGKRGRNFTDIESWRPLLVFTGGNPLTLTIVVGQAVRDGLRAKAAIEAYVATLRSRQAAFQDEMAEGRSRSLGASLRYGFEVGFSEEERRWLSVLALFQGVVDVDALVLMSSPEALGCLEELRGVGRDAWTALLDRVAEVGLLRRYTDYYGVHPALPWFFREVFERHYPPGTGDGDCAAHRVERAWVNAIGGLGNFYCQFEPGNFRVIAALETEEENLLRAWRLSRQNGWWELAISAMQGLSTLYRGTGRRGAWARLVEAVVPDIVDPDTDGPLQGREEVWSLVTSYRVGLASESRDWERAEHLQRGVVDWARGRAKPHLAKPPDSLEHGERIMVRSFAVSLHGLGEIQRKRSAASCIHSYEESLCLLETIADQAAATCALNLGRAYQELPSLRDLDAAERWCGRSLDLRAETDILGLGQCLRMLGSVKSERLWEARTAKRPKVELLQLLNVALGLYHHALDLTPTNALNELAVTHYALGILYATGVQFDRSLMHSRKAIAYQENSGNRFDVATTQHQVAIRMARAGRLHDALDYAHGALKNFEQYGDRAAAQIAKTRQLIAAIEQDHKSPH